MQTTVRDVKNAPPPIPASLIAPLATQRLWPKYSLEDIHLCPLSRHSLDSDPPSPTPHPPLSLSFTLTGRPPSIPHFIFLSSSYAAPLYLFIYRFIIKISNRCLAIIVLFMVPFCIAPVVWSFLSTTAQLYATHRRGSERRKRHRTKCTRMRPWWRSPRRLRVPGHAGRVTLSRHIPPSRSTFTWAKISDFQEKRLKSMTASF